MGCIRQWKDALPTEIYTQSNPLNERWRQTISRWRFVYCVQWNKTAHSLTPEIIIGVDVLHRWKVKVNSIINYLDYNKAMNILRLITLNIQKEWIKGWQIYLLWYLDSPHKLREFQRCDICQRIQLEERFTKIAIKNINCL